MTLSVVDYQGEPLSLSRTLPLGFIAGVTIVLGLPLGRLRRPAPGLRVFLNAIAIGVLVFLVWDVFSAAWEPIDVALGRVHDGDGGLAAAIGYGALFVGGLAVGLIGLAQYERWMSGRTARTARHGSAPAPWLWPNGRVDASGGSRGHRPAGWRC